MVHSYYVNPTKKCLIIYRIFAHTERIVTLEVSTKANYPQFAIGCNEYDNMQLTNALPLRTVIPTNLKKFLQQSLCTIECFALSQNLNLFENIPQLIY